MNEHEKLQDKLKETLSALLDSEAGKTDQLELRRLVRSLDENPELVDKYQRYQLVRATLKREPAVASSLLANVRAAIADEEMEDALMPSSDSSSKKSHANFDLTTWFQAAGRVAIAASVAVIAVYVVQMHPINSGSSEVAAVQGAVSSVSVPLAQNAAAPFFVHNARMLNPNVMTVSAGDRRQPFEQVNENHRSAPVGCVISSAREDKINLIWEKELPAGYVLCKQNGQEKQCESVSSKIGCYLN